MKLLEENGLLYEKIPCNELFPLKKQEEWKEVYENLDNISEIRIRVNQPILISINGKERYLTKEGKFSEEETNYKVFTEKDIQGLLEYWCQNSRYAYEEQIKKGFLTLKNGHRVGICGETVLNDREEITTIKYISSLNVRIAHEMKNCASPLLPFLYEKNKVKNILILSPPGAGKTTLLRELVRIISDGNEWGRGKSITLIDERKEIAACYQGIPQLEIGKRTDVMDSCPKKYGMQMVLRSMGAEVIAVDELGGRDEWELIHEMVRCGTTILATGHADCREEWEKKQEKSGWGKEEIFDLVVELFREGNFFKGKLYEKGKKEPCCIY